MINIENLTFIEKLFCEAMSLLLSGWWLFLIYLLYKLKDYLVVGTCVLVGLAVVIALLEMWIEKDEEHTEKTD